MVLTEFRFRFSNECGVITGGCGLYNCLPPFPKSVSLLFQRLPTRYGFGKFFLESRALYVVPFDFDGEILSARRIVQYINQHVVDLLHYLCLAGVFLARGIDLEVAQPG